MKYAGIVHVKNVMNVGFVIIGVFKMNTEAKEFNEALEKLNTSIILELETDNLENIESIYEDINFKLLLDLIEAIRAYRSIKEARYELKQMLKKKKKLI